MKFEPGDTVKVRQDLEVRKDYGGYLFQKAAAKYKELTIRTITSLDGAPYYVVDGGANKYYWTDEMLITTTTKGETMQKINPMMKRLLDKDTKALYKAGYLNGDLEFTNEGKDALEALVFVGYRAELVLEAEKVIAEEKKAKKA